MDGLGQDLDRIDRLGLGKLGTGKGKGPTEGPAAGWLGWARRRSSREAGETAATTQEGLPPGVANVLNRGGRAARPSIPLPTGPPGSLTRPPLPLSTGRQQQIWVAAGALGVWAAPRLKGRAMGFDTPPPPWRRIHTSSSHQSGPTRRTRRSLEASGPVFRLPETPFGRVWAYGARGRF